jgi:hypothetical protein
MHCLDLLIDIGHTKPHNAFKLLRLFSETGNDRLTAIEFAAMPPGLTMTVRQQTGFTNLTGGKDLIVHDDYQHQTPPKSRVECHRWGDLRMMC